MEHGMQCFARLVRALLGEDAVSAHKLQYGLTLTVLGVDVELNDKGYRCRPALEKKLKICATLESILKEGSLEPGLAQKLSGSIIVHFVDCIRTLCMPGQLNWAGQHLFHRLGRVMLRPLFRQGHARFYASAQVIVLRKFYI